MHHNKLDTIDSMPLRHRIRRLVVVADLIRGLSSVEDGLGVRLDIDESFDDAGTVQCQRPLQRLIEFIRRFSRPAWHTEIMWRRFRRRTEMNSGEMVVLALLLHFHQAQPAVVQNDHRHLQAQAARKR